MNLKLFIPSVNLFTVRLHLQFAIVFVYSDMITSQFAFCVRIFKAGERNVKIIFIKFCVKLE